MRKTTVICDYCKKEKPAEKVTVYSNKDLCGTCQEKILEKVAAGENVKIKKYCEYCQGRGFINKTEYGPYGYHITDEKQRCEHCEPEEIS